MAGISAKRKASAKAGGPFEYVFPAIRGLQAGREFFVSMCPLRLIPKIFFFDEEEIELPAEVRAQRSLNRTRVPEIAAYMLENPESYVFSALTASIDANVRFEPMTTNGNEDRVGALHIPMSARFVINDGQHRRAAIEMAIREHPELADESIAIVFFLDVGLERCQQMFADLNRYAIRASSSLGVLFDHRDEYAALVRLVVAKSPVFRDMVEKERSTLSPRSRKLFTLSAIYTATKSLLSGIDGSPEDQAELAASFWEAVAIHLPDWQAVRERKSLASDIRRETITSHGIVLHALGRAGNALLHESSDPSTWEPRLKGLGKLEWSRANSKVWEGRAMVGGRVSKSSHHVTLTTNVIKKAMDLPLSVEEKRVERAFARGEFDE